MFHFIKDFFAGILDKNAEQSTVNKEDNPDKQFDSEEFSMSDIKVYALSTCIHCRNAKKYLDECGVKYQCIHVDELSGEERKEVVQEIKKHNPAVSFPTIVIKDKVVVGYHKDKIDDALNGDE